MISRVDRVVWLLLVAVLVVFTTTALSRAQSQFEILDNTDLPGFDYGPAKQQRYQDCVASCDSDVNCRAFTFNKAKSACFLKTETGAPKAFSGAISGVKTSQGQASQPRSAGSAAFSVLEEYDLPGGDYKTIRNVNLAQCQNACAADKRCSAFTQNYGKNVCFLKERPGGPLPFKGAISGTKTGFGASVAEAKPSGKNKNGFLIYSDTDMPGGDGAIIDQKSGSLEACQLQCLFNDECDAFTYNHKVDACLGKSHTRIGGDTMAPTPFKGATSGVKLSPEIVAAARKAYVESGPKVPVADLSWRNDDTPALFVSRIRSAAKPMGGDCTVERALMDKIAKSVSVKLSPVSLRVGATIPIEWSASPVAKAPPLWLMISTDGATRFVAPGFYALTPNAIAPFGISVDADRTRTLTALFGQGALKSGKVELAPLRAGELVVSVRAVGYLRSCGEEFSQDIESVTIPVSPSTTPIFQVRDPFSFDSPTTVWLSPYGQTKLEVFKDRFRLVDMESGAFLADREGKDPAYSPTGRFVIFQVDDGLELIDAVDGASVGKTDGIIGWENQDSFAVAGGFGYGAINAIDLLVADTKVGGASQCRRCLGREESYVLDLENDVVHDGSGRYAQRLSGLRQSSNIPGGDRNAHIRFIAEQTAAAPAFMPTGWTLRGGLKFARYDPWIDSGGDGDLTDWQKEDVAHTFFAEKVTNERTVAGLQPVAIGKWRGAVRLQKPKSQEGAIRQRLADIGLSFSNDQPPSYVNDDAHAESAAIAKRIAEGNRPVARRFVPAEQRTGCQVDQDVPNADEKVLAEFYQAVEYRIGGRSIWLTMLACQEGSAGFYYPGFLLFDNKLKNGVFDIDGDNPNTDIGTTCQGNISYCEFQSRLYADRYLLIWSRQSRGIMLFDLNERKTIFKEFNLGRGDLLKEAFYSVDDQHVIQVNFDGSFYVYDARGGERVMEGRYVDDEAVAWTPDLHFDASPEGANYVNLRFPGQNGQYAFQQFAAMVKRPGLAREVFGRRYKVSSEALPLPPRLSGDVRMNGDRIAGSIKTSGAKTIRIYQDGLLTDSIDVGQTEANISVDIHHASGARWISLVAYSQSGVASLPVGKDVAAGVPIKPTVHVLAVGVDTYSGKGLQRLAYARRDAETLLDAITAQNGKSLTLGTASKLTDDEATPGRILDKVREVIDSAKKGDTVVFSFAGHGVTGPDGRFFLATSDTDADKIADTALPWEKLASVLAKSEARVLVFLDACHSGTAGTSLFATNDDAAEDVLDGGPAGLLVFSASKGRQFSEESPAAGGGLFTNAVADVISRDRSAYDLDGNGAIEISELYAGVKRKVSDQSSGRQVPWLARNALIGDFAIF